MNKISRHPEGQNKEKSLTAGLVFHFGLLALALLPLLSNRLIPSDNSNSLPDTEAEKPMQGAIQTADTNLWKATAAEVPQ